MMNCIVQISQEKKSQTINRVINLGENGYFKDLGITIELKSTSGRRKDLSEMA